MGTPSCPATRAMMVAAGVLLDTKNDVWPLPLPPTASVTERVAAYTPRAAGVNTSDGPVVLTPGSNALPSRASVQRYDVMAAPAGSVMLLPRVTSVPVTAPVGVPVIRTTGGFGVTESVL